MEIESKIVTSYELNENDLKRIILLGIVADPKINHNPHLSLEACDFRFSSDQGEKLDVNNVVLQVVHTTPQITE